MEEWKSAGHNEPKTAICDGKKLDALGPILVEA